MNTIERFRRDRGLTFEGLGKCVGLNRAQVWKHCKASTVPAEAAIRYHITLGIPLSDLRPDLCANTPDRRSCPERRQGERRASGRCDAGRRERDRRGGHDKDEP